MRSLEHFGQFFRNIETARNKASAHTQCESRYPCRAIDRTGGSRRAASANPAGGGGLPLGQAINLVVEQQNLHVHIAAQHMHQMVATDGQPIAVAGYQPHIQIRIGQFDAGCNGWRPSVDRVEAITLDVIGEPAGAADPADKASVGRITPQLRQGALHRLQDGIVPATRAPTNLLISFPIFQRGFNFDWCVHDSAPLIASIISSMVKG